MARQARQKSEQAAFYHLFNRAAGDPRDLPFDRGANARRFLSIFEFYLGLYCCRLASFQLMGNHYHCVVQFEGFRPLSREQLEEKARLRFGRRRRLRTRHWDASRWEQFQRHLFDVSCFMQHVNGEFAKWFNRRWGRRGPFWADRFKNPQLLNEAALLRREQERGFGRPGLLRRRLRFLTDGIAIGDRNSVQALLERYRREGLYRRRKNPIPQLGGLFFSLREQRSHAFCPG